MKFQYLGTSAAEGFPALFCNCKYCNEARRLGGKNVRTRSQAIINDELLLDAPQDTYCHFLTHGIMGHKIKYLFFTHTHQDHFYPGQLDIRNTCYAHDMDVPVLKVFCSRDGYEKLTEQTPEPLGFEAIRVEPFVPVELDEYTVIPLEARHQHGTEAVFYIIRGDKTVLYAHDTGYFPDSVWAYLEKEKIRFDMISLDCTNVDIPISDTGSHMGIPNILRAVERLEKLGCVDEKTIKIVNHFSHNGNPLHEVLENRVNPLGYDVSYDGMVVEI